MGLAPALALQRPWAWLPTSVVAAKQRGVCNAWHDARDKVVASASAASPHTGHPLSTCPAAVTRGLQVTVLAFLFAGSYDDMSGCHKLGLWWANLACVVAISAVQA